MPALMRMIVIADDLTGAAEVAAGYAAAGFDARVRLPAWLSDGAGAARIGESHVLVVDTETRQAGEDEARRVLADVMAQLGPGPGVPVYKKIDSTLRGPVAAEIAMLMKLLGTERALIAPAFPAQGRTTQQGVQFVRGVPVDRAEAPNESNPAATSNLPSLLEHGTGRATALVGLTTVESGAAHLSAHLEAAFARTPLVVVDAVTDAHLDTIGASLPGLQPMPLIVGSAGLARILARQAGQGTDDPAARLPHPRGSIGVLVACGSRHPVSLEQAERLRAGFELPVFRLERAGRDHDDGTLSNRLETALRAGDALLLAPRESMEPSGRLKGEVAGRLGGVIADVCGRLAPGGLVLTGGETAYRSLRALGIDEFAVHGELRDGIALGTIVHPAAGSVPIVTKAGGFGGPAALVEAIDHLRARTGPGVRNGDMTARRNSK